MATTWAATGNRSVKATCTTGTESAPTNPVKASQTVAFSSAVAGNTVTIRGLTFTAIANGGTPADNTQFAVGAGGSANTDTGTTFAAAVNANQGRLGLTAVNASGTVTLTADSYGTYANAWTLVRVGAPITLGGATLANGVDVVGLPLSDVGSVSVKAEAVTAGQTITGGTLNCYVLNGRSGRYLRYADGDLTVGAAVQGYGWSFTVQSPIDYILWVPTGVTISSGNAIVYIDAVETDNRPTSGRTL